MRLLLATVVAVASVVPCADAAVLQLASGGPCGSLGRELPLLPAPRQGGTHAEPRARIVRYEFRAALLNGAGVSSLEDLRGKPVLVEFWGTRCPGCVAEAVPRALALQAEHGDDLQVVLVESQWRGEREHVERFALAQRWLASRAMWTTESPLRVPGNTLPKFALLSADGELLLQGNPIRERRALEGLVEREVERRREGPEDLSKSLRRAWREFARGKRARALGLLEELRCGDGPDAARAAELIGELEGRVDRELDRAEWLAENGRVLEAEVLARELARSLKGAGHYELRVTALERRLESPALEAEREAARAFARLEAEFQDDGPDENLAVQLERLAERHAGTKTAERALRWATLCRPE